MDRYSRAKTYLCRFPEQLPGAFMAPHLHQHAGCLFQYVTPSGCYVPVPKGKEQFGCLVLVRNGSCIAWTESLTERIREDERIPLSLVNLSHRDLDCFAQWNRIIDVELKRAL